MHTTLKTAIAAAATVLSLSAAAAPGLRDFDVGDIDQLQARQFGRIERAFARAPATTLAAPHSARDRPR